MVTDVEHELDGAKEIIPHYKALQSRMQAGVIRILSQTKRLRAGTMRDRDQTLKHLQSDLYDYQNATFASLKLPTTNHCGRVGRSVQQARGRLSLCRHPETVRGSICLSLRVCLVCITLGDRFSLYRYLGADGAPTFLVLCCCLVCLTLRAVSSCVVTSRLRGGVAI